MTEQRSFSSDYFVDKGVATQLDKALSRVVKENSDRVYIIDGREGLGKSTLALQLAAGLDPNFNIEKIVFSPEDFEYAVRHSERYSAIVFDEAFNGLSSKGSLSKENKRLVRLLMECRQQNLFIFIVLPSIFMLEKYAAIHRAHALFHVVPSQNRERYRAYVVYNYKLKKLLYIKGKQMMSYSFPRMGKLHQFYATIPPNVDKSEYVRKKLDSFRNEDKGDEVIKQTRQRDILVRYLRENHSLSYQDICVLFERYGFPIHWQTLSRSSKWMRADNIPSTKGILN